jgi:hypothetical protein
MESIFFNIDLGLIESFAQLDENEVSFWFRSIEGITAWPKSAVLGRVL